MRHPLGFLGRLAPRYRFQPDAPCPPSRWTGGPSTSATSTRTSSRLGRSRPPHCSAARRAPAARAAGRSNRAFPYLSHVDSVQRHVAALSSTSGRPGSDRGDSSSGSRAADQTHFYIYTRVRTAVVLAMVTAVSAGCVLGMNAIDVRQLTMLAAFITLYNIVAWFFFRRYRDPDAPAESLAVLLFLTYAAVVLDFVALTVAIWFVGGARRSPLTSFYILHMLVSCTLSSPKGRPRADGPRLRASRRPRRRRVDGSGHPDHSGRRGRGRRAPGRAIRVHDPRRQRIALRHERFPPPRDHTLAAEPRAADAPRQRRARPPLQQEKGLPRRRGPPTTTSCGSGECGGDAPRRHVRGGLAGETTGKQREWPTGA